MSQSIASQLAKLGLTTSADPDEAEVSDAVSNTLSPFTGKTVQDLARRLGTTVEESDTHLHKLEDTDGSIPVSSLPIVYIECHGHYDLPHDTKRIVFEDASGEEVLTLVTPLDIGLLMRDGITMGDDDSTEVFFQSIWPDVQYSYSSTIQGDGSHDYEDLKGL